MVNINAFTGVGVAGMSWTLHVAAAPSPRASRVAAHAAAGPQLRIMPQRKRRTTAATVTSVDRGTT